MSVHPFTRRILFPEDRLATSFGREDGNYAWKVFGKHRERLERAGFASASRILEVGPGRNLGTALLWWLQSGSRAHVKCWDVFRNAHPESPSYWRDTARELLRTSSECSTRYQTATEIAPLLAGLRGVADERLEPDIAYHVSRLEEIESLVAEEGCPFDLIYSQAVIEHIWDVDKFWEAIERMMRPGGWQSHRIDLADHGSRANNYIEMLEWSRASYWITMRFVPGACNRWRAGQHLAKLESLGLRILDVGREIRPDLPIPLSRMSAEFRGLGADELRTTELDIVACKPGSPC